MGTCPVTGYQTAPAADFYPEGMFGLWSLDDAGLARIRRQHLRAAADFARGDMGPDPAGDLTQARREWYMAREIHDHQLMRFRLRMRYGAIDDHLGTTAYDCYIRHDERPSYGLALFMDSTKARLGLRHVLQWPEAS